MSSPLLCLLLALLAVATIPRYSDGQEEQWCIADPQTPDESLQGAMAWACWHGADCSKIQVNQPCYEPITVKDHASYVFNSYYQKFKHQGATCYFNGAAMSTELDPSNGSCKFEILA